MCKEHVDALEVDDMWSLITPNKPVLYHLIIHQDRICLLLKAVLSFTSMLQRGGVAQIPSITSTLAMPCDQLGLNKRPNLIYKHIQSVGISCDAFLSGDQSLDDSASNNSRFAASCPIYLRTTASSGSKAGNFWSILGWMGLKGAYHY